MEKICVELTVALLGFSFAILNQNVFALLAAFFLAMVTYVLEKHQHSPIFIFMTLITIGWLMAFHLLTRCPSLVLMVISFSYTISHWQGLSKQSLVFVSLLLSGIVLFSVWLNDLEALAITMALVWPLVVKSLVSLVCAHNFNGVRAQNVVK